MPLQAARVVFPSKHSPGPSPYMGWKWSKPQIPSKPRSSAKRARDAFSDHDIRCCAMSSPNFMPGLLSRLPSHGMARSQALSHVAMSVPPGTLTDEWRAQVLDFYGEVFGWKEMDEFRLPDRLTISVGST